MSTYHLFSSLIRLAVGRCLFMIQVMGSVGSNNQEQVWQTQGREEVGQEAVWGKPRVNSLSRQVGLLQLAPLGPVFFLNREDQCPRHRKYSS